jgi:hypothetical protein
MRSEKKRIAAALLVNGTLFAVCATPMMAQSFAVFDGAPDALHTFVNSINDSAVVGWSVNASGGYHGFVRDPSGNLTVFDCPNAPGTVPLSINASGAVAGYTGDYHGFVRDPSGELTVFDAPNALLTEAYSINDSGAVAGWFYDTTRYPPGEGKGRGFVRDASGNFTVFDAPERPGNPRLQHPITRALSREFSMLAGVPAMVLCEIRAGISSSSILLTQ